MTALQPPPASTPSVVVVAKPSRPVGSTTLRCTVTIAGALTQCEVASEDPAGVGLGATALKVVTRFQVRPALRDGHPVESRLILPFQFQMAGDEAPVPAGSGASSKR